MNKKRTAVIFVMIATLLSGCGTSKKPMENPLTNLPQQQVQNSGVQQNNNNQQNNLQTTANNGQQKVSTSNTYNYEQLYFKQNLTTDEKVALFDFYMQLRKNEVFTNANATPDNIQKIYNVIATTQMQVTQDMNEQQKQTVQQFNKLYAEQNLGYKWTMQGVQWLNDDRAQGTVYVSTDMWNQTRVVEEGLNTFTVQTIYQTSGYWVNSTTNTKTKEQKPDYKTKYYYFVYLQNMGWRIYQMVEK